MSTNIIPGISRNAQNICRPIEEWVLENPVLLPGQIGIVEDIPNKPFKFGDGKTHWNDLKFQDEFPHHLLSMPHMRDSIIPAGTPFEVPEYIVYEVTDNNRGNYGEGFLVVKLDDHFCYPRVIGTTGTIAGGIAGSGYVDVYELIGEVGQPSKFIRFTFDVKARMKIEVTYNPAL